MAGLLIAKASQLIGWRVVANQLVRLILELNVPAFPSDQMPSRSIVVRSWEVKDCSIRSVASI
jgi:hypothetical protein